MNNSDLLPMEISFVGLDKIPFNAFVIRVKDTRVYIHLNDNILSLRERMNGCFTCSEETAEDLLKQLSLIAFSEEMEIVKFHDAYFAHGLIEKQILFN